jgi:hypothetical protein
MMNKQMVLGILGFCGNFCGEWLMHKRGSGKVSELWSYKNWVCIKKIISGPNLN